MRDSGRRSRADDSSEAAQALVTAALTPPTFRAVYDYYQGNKFPEPQFFVNTIIREFNVDTKQAETCADMFAANTRYRRVNPRHTRRRLAFGEDRGGATTLPSQVDEAQHDAEEVATSRSRKDRRTGRFRPARQSRAAEPDLHRARAQPQAARPTDEDARHMGIPSPSPKRRPRSDVRSPEGPRDDGAVRRGDPDFQRRHRVLRQGRRPIWRPSENVSHELGAASVMYEDRIILFKEESVQLASNYSGIGYITFEKDALDAKVNDLLRELVAFKILKLSLSDDE